MTTSLPLVTIVVPCRNEEQFIVKSLDSLCANTYPAHCIEFLVVDGMSTDRTRDLVRDYAATHPNVRLLDNPKRNIPAAMNVGIQNARGELIFKADAHSLYPVDYIERCVDYMLTTDVENVGGIFAMHAADTSLLSEAIALSLTHPLGAGNAPQFSHNSATPRYADTAAFGCYRRELFERIGMYNEEILRSADMDLNTRLRHAGGRILLDPSIVVDYFPRPGFREFALRNWKVGFWVFYALKFGGRATRMRHVAPLVALLLFILMVIGALFYPQLWIPVLFVCALYAAGVLTVSTRIALAKNKPGLLLYLPVIFPTRHVLYAVASLYGLIRAALSSRFWRELSERRSGTRPVPEVLVNR